jgi:hypothetical protein
MKAPPGLGLDSVVTGDDPLDDRAIRCVLPLTGHARSCIHLLYAALSSARAKLIAAPVLFRCCVRLAHETKLSKSPMTPAIFAACL